MTDAEPSSAADLSVTVEDRRLSVWTGGAEAGPALLFQPGTPAPPVRWDSLESLARARGVRVIAYARPGYSGSTPAPGRSVADAASDVAAVMSAVGAEEFVTVGHSGGGPHALACAALLPGRCRAAASLAGVAPYAPFGERWLAGMAEENLAEFAAAFAGEDALRTFLTHELAGFTEVTAAEVAASLRGLASPVDQAALVGDYADMLARSFRSAAADGLEGWVEDDLAFVTDWGFDLSAIEVPVAVWQGREDAMVPYAHGEWLARTIGTARPRLFDDEGHLSLANLRLADIVEDLLQLGDLTR